MRILYVTTVSGMMSFFQEHFKMLVKKGCEVELACNNEFGLRSYIECFNFKIHDISFSRTPFSKRNIFAFLQIKELIKNGGYDVIHCHSPVAAFLTRIACFFCKNNAKVIYTAHGFHFYSGAPIKNWVIYGVLEYFCSFITDVLIVINQEDYSFSQKHLHAKEIYYVPGVGFDKVGEGNGSCSSRREMRKIFKCLDEELLIVSVGELNDNKNHIVVINALADLKKENPRLKFKFIICGKGNLKEKLLNAIEGFGLQKEVMLLGYRNDISEILNAADLFVFPSYREGLSVALMEAMNKQLPVICSRIRGNVDLIDKAGGYLFDPSDKEELLICLKKFIQLTKKEKDAMGKCNQEKVDTFSTERVLSELEKIYLLK